MEFFSQLHRNARWQWLWLQTSFSLEPNGSCWSSSLWQSPGCKLLPLFYGLKCKEFRNQKRQDRWFKRWDRWTEEDNRVNVDAWKSDLRKLGRVNGLVFSKALSEVSYREEVLNTLCRMMQSSSRDELSIGVDECIPVKGDYNSARLPAGRFQRWSPVVLK